MPKRACAVLAGLSLVFSVETHAALLSPTFFEGTIQAENKVWGTNRHHFHVAISNQLYLIDARIEGDNTNNIAQWIQGGDAQETYALWLDPKGERPTLAELGPPIGQRSKIKSLLRDDLTGQILWMLFASQTTPPLPHQVAFSFHDGQLSNFQPDELTYHVEINSSSPCLPAYVRLTSPGYAWVPSKPKMLSFPGSKSAWILPWPTKRKYPLPPPFQNGKTLWELRTDRWTNFAGGIFPAAFTYLRPYDLGALAPGQDPSVLTNPFWVNKGTVHTIRAATTADFERPKIRGDIPVADYRFERLMGPYEIVYRTTNRFWTPVTDSNLNALALKTRGQYLKKENYRAHMPKPRVTFTAIFVTSLSGLGILVLCAEARRSWKKKRQR